MAVTFRAESHITPGAPAGATVTTTEPSGAAQDDLMLALTYCEGSTYTSTPSGWTTLRQGVTTINAFAYWIGYVVRGASAPGLSFTAAATPTWAEFVICAWSGCSTVDPIGAFDLVEGPSAAFIDPPSITPRRADSLLVSGGWSQGGCNAANWTPSSGYTIRNADSTNPDLAVQEKQQTGGPTADNPGTITTAFTSQYVGMALTLQEPYTAPSPDASGQGKDWRLAGWR